MDDVTVQCPYCSETVTIEIDPATSGALVQDCEVCCRPWQINVSRDDNGCLSVTVERAQ